MYLLYTRGKQHWDNINQNASSGAHLTVVEDVLFRFLIKQKQIW
jgi:hypothetical protein